MKYILGRINESMDHLPYNFYLHTSPAGKSLHFHMEFCPKISTLAGFELGSGMYLNIMPPEEAAKFYRGEKT
jgi:UDPglucose--hexose-1-phosphate uridylyltransferase